MASVERIFVYGTLRRGMRQHSMLSGAMFRGLSKTEPAFTLLDAGAWPAAISGGQTSIGGEVYNLPGEQLEALDAYERHPHFFRRFHVVLADTRLAWMWVYISDIEPHWQFLPDGCWRKE